MIKKSILIFAAVILVGCASPATQQAMSITIQDVPTKVNPELKGQMVVRDVTGGKETNPMWTSQVDTQGFKGALDKSIAVAGYRANDTTAAKYKIDANLQKLDQPLVGFTLDVESTVMYTVSGDGKQKQFPITATGTASTSDAFIAIERLRMANERSIKENIKLFMQKLSEQIAW